MVTEPPHNSSNHTVTQPNDGALTTAIHRGRSFQKRSLIDLGRRDENRAIVNSCDKGWKRVDVQWSGGGTFNGGSLRLRQPATVAAVREVCEVRIVRGGVCDVCQFVNEKKSGEPNQERGPKLVKKVV
jgi:hypothetical protein